MRLVLRHIPAPISKGSVLGIATDYLRKIHLFLITDYLVTEWSYSNSGFCLLITEICEQLSSLLSEVL
jgi:hypothetical protein